MIIAYYLLVVLPHEEVGKFIARTMDVPMGRDKYNLVILLMGGAGFLAYLWTLWTGVRRTNRLKPILFYLVTTLGLIILTIKTLMVVNVEIIHIVQYGVFAILLYPLLYNYKETLFFVIVFGALDEAYQYWVLAPFRTEYYDFNDVVINLLGGALGIIALAAAGVKEQKRPRWTPDWPLLLTGVIAVIAVICYDEGILGIFPLESVDVQAPVLLVRKIQPEFWTVLPPEVKFHVLRPLEGSILTILLFQFYKKVGAINTAS